MKNKKGITLIEVLVTAGLTSIITLLIVYVYINGMQISDFNFKRFNASSNLDAVINNISQYSLLATSSPTTFDYGGKKYTDDSDTLILQIPSINSTGEVINGYFDSIVYDYSATNKKLNELIVPNVQSSRALKDKTVAQNVAAVSFNQADTPKGLIQNIDMTINATSFGETTDYSLSKSVRMRNQSKL